MFFKKLLFAVLETVKMRNFAFVVYQTKQQISKKNCSYGIKNLRKGKCQ